MKASEKWINAIREACAEPDAVACNRRITTLHFDLSEALAEALGRDGGPNFHSWAVWGSRRAGVTIRQEDLDGAIVNAASTAGIVGSAVGGAVGVLLGAGWLTDYLAAAIGAGAGALAGGWTGKRIGIWSRAKAARLVLEGNRTVLQDIGAQSARFLELLEGGALTHQRAVFFEGLRPGPTERLGQDRLARAFRSYLEAFEVRDPDRKRAAMIEGNCEIVYHEHIRLEPYIRGAMPWIVRRCATQRLMTYEVGESVLTVGEDLPGTEGKTAASNWARIEDRMRYVFALFRKFHTSPDVFTAPHL